MKRKLSVLALSLVFALFAGCSNGAVSSGADGKDVTLELYLQKTNVVDQFTEIISRFEKANPGIKIELTSVPDPETALVSRIAANDYPDIITIWPAESFYRDLMRDGALMDISDQAFLDVVEEGARSIAQFDDKDYALSMTMSAYGILVNNTLFEEQGIEKPTTWVELIAACEKFKANNILPFAMYGKSTEQLGQLAERIIGVIDNDITSTIDKVGKGETSWDKESQMKQLAEAMLQLHSYGQKDILGADYEAAFNDFTTGKAAMMIYGSWAVQRLQGMNEDLDMEMIPLPNPTGGDTNVAVSIDTALCISEASENKEAALKFLEFMASVETAQWYADNEKNPSVIKGVNYSVPPLMEIQKKLTAGDIFFTPSVYWPGGFRNAWSAPLQGLIDPTSSQDITAFLTASEELCVEYFANL